MDGRHRQRSLDGDEGAQSGVAGFEFEGGETVFDGGTPRAAVPLQMHAEEAELAHLTHDLGRKDRAFVPFGDVRADPLVDEAADLFAQRQLVVGEESGEVEQVGGVGGGGVCGFGSHGRLLGH